MRGQEGVNLAHNGGAHLEGFLWDKHICMPRNRITELCEAPAGKNLYKKLVIVTLKVTL